MALVKRDFTAARAGNPSGGEEEAALHDDDRTGGGAEMAAADGSAHVPIKFGEGEGNAGFREDGGFQGRKGEIVAEFLDLVVAPGVGAKDFENHARGIGEKRVARHRHANDHSIGGVEGFLALAERNAKLEVAAGGKAGLPGELVARREEEMAVTRW